MIFIIQVIPQKDLNVITLGRCSNIVILDELLLFADHILQVNYCAGLQLKIQQQLDILRLKEIIFHDELKIVFVVLHFDPVTIANGITNCSDLCVIFVQISLH